MITLPTSMTAIALHGKGGPEVLVAESRALPMPGPGQVLIKVAAAGVNRPDILQRQGGYPPPPGASDLPGLEAAGTIAAVGDGVAGWQPGSNVMALLNGGGYATYAIAQAGSCLPVPAGLSMIEAAGVPETFFTVWHNLFERGRLQAGEWVLIHGGTSGIGVAAVQLAASFGARVIATCGNQRKCEAAMALGATRAIDYKSEDFVAVVAQATSGHGCDLILDMVGGDYVERNIKAASVDGRIVNIAFQRGSTVTVDLGRAMVKRLTLTGSTLRPRTNAVKAQIAQSVIANALPLLASGKVKILIDRTFPLEQAAQAHAHLEAGDHIGKVILTV